MRKAVNAVLRQRYADLVRFAYLVLDDGEVAAGVRLAVARRLVREAVRGRPAGDGYKGLRRSLTARLLGDSAPPRWRDRVSWSRAEPALTRPGPVRAALRELSPHERLAYLLSRTEGLTAPEVSAELGDFLLVSAYDVDGSMARVDAATGLDAAAQQAELRSFDPTLVRLRPPGSHATRQRLIAAGLVVALVAAVFAVWERRHEAPPLDALALVKPELWRLAEFPGWSDWPTQGELREDRALLRRAEAAWRRNRYDPPFGKLTLLYAGRQEDATFVVMRDSPGVRDSPMLAQYVEREQAEGVSPQGRYGRIEVLRKLGGDSGQLIRLSGTLRFLVPPWRTNVEFADPATPEPRWRRVPVHGGITGRIPLILSDPECYYLVLRTTNQANGTPHPIVTLIGRAPERATPAVWFRRRDHGSGNEVFSGDPEQWTALRAIACAPLLGQHRSNDVRVGWLWRGDLPEDGGRASLLTLDSDEDLPSMAVLVSPGGDVLGGAGPAANDHPTSTEQTTGAVWWMAAGSRRWYLLAAAGPEITKLELLGELGRHSVGGPDGKVLMRRGPVLWNGPPPDGRPALVQVIAHTGNGTRLVLTP